MFLTDMPAMFIDKTLVIADLHIGITRELYESGISIPSQVEKLAKTLNKLGSQTKANRLVILGDLKHKVPGISYQELKEVPEFLSLLEFKEVVIVKGNHDGGIENMVESKDVFVKKSFSMDDFYFTHGHRKANTKKRNIVIGHNHPHVQFRDELGALYTEPIWIIGKAKIKNQNHNLILMPAFNELCGATIVNRDSLLGPIAKKIRDAHVFLLDGTDIGLIKDLKFKK